jgi:hypothetical protein
MTSVSDFDQLQGLLGDKGNLLGTQNGTFLVRPEPKAGDSATSVTHVISHLTYLDATGHVHAVLLDTVTTYVDGVTVGGSTTIEILSDVQIT